ncbi:YncE family protein [Polaribacter sp. Asnod1-A03]|uniref:YncE family protein n=1 Tax=Polaribacter sp. Asnod1-A03 TaxID=3160581 RepID=UPI0038644642
MNIKKTFFLVALSGVLFASCNNNESDLPKGDYENGILIANEGAFSGGTGTVNFISEDYLTEESTIFSNVNGESIGTILQSIGFNGDDAYLIANVGNKISIADRYTMEKLTDITEGLSNPRYIAFANGKGYVTNWGEGSDATDDYIAVIDLASNTISTTIAVSEGPEQVVADGNTLYVSHKGGWGSGNTVSVINTSSDTLESTITVGNVPDEMVIDNSGNLLVSCEGSAWSSPELLGSLVTINTSSNTVNATIDYDSGFHPGNMVLSDANIYLSTSSDVYKMSEGASEIPTSSIISTTVYGMSVNEGKIYVTDVKDYVSNGTLKIFDASTNVELNEFTVGLIPGKIYFN